jgi:parallel beta-helix repeat protein
VAIAVVCVLPALWSACGHHEAASEDSVASFEKNLQEQLILAKPGSVIDLPEGYFHVSRVLSLTVDNVTRRAKGMDKTVLSFKVQTSGSAGLLVTANGFTAEDIAFEDMAGDGAKVNGGATVTFRRVPAEWTRGPNSGNGGYGIYPVHSD